MVRLKMFRLLLAVLLLLMAFTVPLLAQEGTDEPTPDVPSSVLRWSAELVFPQVIRFHIVIAYPMAELSSVNLNIRPPGQQPVVIAVDVAASALTTESDYLTELAYFWNIPRDAPPQLFRDIVYSWHVVTSRGEVVAFTDTVFFADPRVEWVEDEDPLGMIHLVVPGEGINPAQVRDSVRDIYDLMLENVGRRSVFNIVLLNVTLPDCSINDDGQLVVTGVSFDEGGEVPCDPALVEAAYSTGGYTPVRYDTLNPIGSSQAAITELFTETYYLPIWQDGDVPAWFRAGLVQFYLPTLKFEMLQPVQEAARNSRLFSLGEMASEPVDTGDPEYAVWRAQSYGMVLFIANDIGVPGLFQLANDAGTADSFAAAYEDAVGQPLEVLLPRWENWIFTDFAFDAFGYTPYLAVTPTPTITRTLTPFPPTPTPVPTSTDTPTPTPTVTGVLSATPLPTLTPSDTPRPPTATITPRPAGSIVDTPTPVPVEIPEEASPLGLAVVAGVFVVLAVLSFIYLRILREQG